MLGQTVSELAAQYSPKTHVKESNVLKNNVHKKGSVPKTYEGSTAPRFPQTLGPWT